MSDEGQASLPPPTVNATSAEAPKKMTPEEQQQYLRKRLEEHRKKKAEEEKEREKQMELERIKSSKEAQQSYEKLQEVKQKYEEERMKKEKQDDAIARKKIKEQIEKDKLERKKAREEQSKSSETATTTTNSTTNKTKPLPSASATTEIIFRKLDGTTIRSQFNSTDKLRVCYDYVKENTGYRNFTMLINFPRKTFTDDDMSKSLRDLQLVPNATIILSSPDSVVTNYPSSSSSSSNITRQTQSTNNGITSYIYSIWNSSVNTVSSFIWPQDYPSNQQYQPADRYTQNNQSSNTSENAPTSGSSLTHRRGVATLHNRNDTNDPDRNQNWNGNSTQTE